MRLQHILGLAAVGGVGYLWYKNKKSTTGSMTTGQPSNGSGNDLSGQRVLSADASKQLDAFFGNYVLATAPTGDANSLLLVGQAPAAGSTTDSSQYMSTSIGTAKKANANVVFFVPPEVAGVATLGDAASAPANPKLLVVDPTKAPSVAQNAIAQGWYRYTPGL
jgi:hypothetical protein